MIHLAYLDAKNLLVAIEKWFSSFESWTDCVSCMIWMKWKVILIFFCTRMAIFHEMALQNLILVYHFHVFNFANCLKIQDALFKLYLLWYFQDHWVNDLSVIYEFHCRQWTLADLIVKVVWNFLNVDIFCCLKMYTQHWILLFYLIYLWCNK